MAFQISFLVLITFLASCAQLPGLRGPAGEGARRDCGLGTDLSLEERIQDCDQVLNDHAKEPIARWAMRDLGKEYIYDVIFKTLWAPASETQVTLEEARKSCGELNETFPQLHLKWKIASKEDYLRAFDKWYAPRSSAQKIAYPDERQARIFPHLILVREQKYFWTNTRVKLKLPGASDYHFLVDQRPNLLFPVRKSLSDRYSKTAHYRCVGKHLDDPDLSDQEN